jgi:hypothetical protein
MPKNIEKTSKNRKKIKKNPGPRFEIRLLKSGFFLKNSDLEGLENGRHVPDDVFEGMGDSLGQSDLLERF